jgi:hypothetical protein
LNVPLQNDGDGRVAKPMKLDSKQKGSLLPISRLPASRKFGAYLSSVEFSANTSGGKRLFAISP